MLATQSIEARARQEGCRQACTIGLSINEDTKLEKGKEKKGSAARSFMRSSSHVSSRDCVYHNVYHNPLFSTSAVTSPPPSVKPTLRLCVSILYLQGVLVLILFQQLIIFLMLVLHLFIKVLWGSRLIRVLIMELFKLLEAAYKILSGVPSWVWIVAFLLDTVFQHSTYQFTGQYFIDFPFIISINLNQQGRLILLFG